MNETHPDSRVIAPAIPSRAALCAMNMALQYKNGKLRESLSATLAQLKHVEYLRRLDLGPVPATLSPDIISEAEKALLEAAK